MRFARMIPVSYMVLSLGFAPGVLSAQTPRGAFERPFRVIDSIPTPRKLTTALKHLEKTAEAR